MVASGFLRFSHLSFQKSNIGWPQQPSTEKVLKFNMIFCDSTQNFFFQNIKTKLKSSVVIFQALEPLQPDWPQQPPQPYFIKEVPNPDGLILPGTKMTNNGPFLWNGSSKIYFFTNI